MIVGKVAKAVLKLILPDVTEHLLKIFKLDKLVNYMELENDADKGIKKLEDKTNMQMEQLKDNTRIISELQTSIAHMENAFKKLKNMKKFKIGK